MTPAEVARLLAKAAAFDQRTVGDADVMAWHEAVADLDPALAMRAVTRWYQRNEQRITVAALRTVCNGLRGEDRQARRDAAHDERLRAIDAGDLKDRSADILELARSLAAPRGHNLTLRRRDMAGGTWAWSCSCGLNPPGQSHPGKDAARTAGRAHIPAPAAVG
jgi:hypothetical protein